MGNLGSIANMIKRIGYKSLITSDISQIKSAEKLILPGVGSFDKAMQNINELNLFDIIRNKSLNNKTPVLGICLGMKIMCNHSQEGKLPGLGIINAQVKRFSFNENQKLRIPHMGWNTVELQKENPLFINMTNEPRFYFVHSYHVICNNKSDVLTKTNYDYDFHSSFAHENIHGVQFHPEKSHKFGMQLLKNFIENY